MNKMIGRCRFCGQSRIVAAAPDDATQDLLDQIATDECDCDGATQEQSIRYLVDRAEWSINRIVAKRTSAAAAILRAGAEAVARRQIKKISVNVDGAMTASLYLSGAKIVAECRKTEVYVSDGELEDGMEPDEDPGQTEAKE